MNSIQKRTTGLTPTTIVAMKPEKLKAANFIKGKFERALIVLGETHDSILLNFFSYISELQQNPENTTEFIFAFTPLFNDLEDLNYFKQAVILICQHEHSYFSRSNINDFVYLKEENKRLNFPLEEKINFTSSILRIMDSFVRHIYEGKNSLFQSSLLNQNKKKIEKHSIILNFFQNHAHAEAEHLIYNCKKIDPNFTKIQELKIHMNYMKENKDKVCILIKYMQEKVDERYCYLKFNNKEKLLNLIKSDPVYIDKFQNYFGEELDDLIEMIYSLCLSDISRSHCAPLLYDFGDTQFSQGCTILIESFGKQYLQLESDFESQIKDCLQEIVDKFLIVKKNLLNYLKLTFHFSSAFVGSSLFLGTLSVAGQIYSNPVLNLAVIGLPYSILVTAFCSSYAAIKTVSYVDKLIDEISNLFLELIDLCDPDDIFSYIYKRNLSQMQPYLSAQGIDISIHTGKTSINYFGIKIIKDIANNVATFGMNSFRPTTNWWLNSVNFRKPAYPNLETETLQSYKNQVKDKIQEALTHKLSFSEYRAYASYIDKFVIEPYMDPILNKILKKNRNLVLN